MGVRGSVVTCIAEVNNWFDIVLHTGALDLYRVLEAQTAPVFAGLRCPLTKDLQVRVSL